MLGKKWSHEQSMFLSEEGQSRASEHLTNAGGASDPTTHLQCKPLPLIQAHGESWRHSGGKETFI